LLTAFVVGQAILPAAAFQAARRAANAVTFDASVPGEESLHRFVHA
jgi:hypothetical protein